MQEKRKSVLSELLSDRNIRSTAFRLEVLDLIERQSEALALSKLERHLGNFDRITLYRTLKTFVETGLIHEVMLPGSEKMFAMCESNCDHSHSAHFHSHAHFRCSQCHKVSCVELDTMPSLKVKGHQIQAIEFSLEGICPACIDA